jgi:hypothetical protein
MPKDQKGQNSKFKKVNFNNNNNNNEAISFNIVDDTYSNGNYSNDYFNENVNNLNNRNNLTYDDMLASMCMRVQNGNLCMIKDDSISDQSQTSEQYIGQNRKQSQTKSNVNVNPNINNTINNNSYIYNKYFQKYKQNDGHTSDGNDINELNNLLLSGQITREEYKKTILIKLIEERNRKIHLQKVKSKKLLFSNANINISGANVRRNPANMNKLFRFAGPGPLPYPNGSMHTNN